MQFIETPGDGWEGRDQLQQTPSANDISAHALWAGHGFRHVGDAAVAPPADLIAEGARVTEPREAHSAIAHDTPICMLAAPHRSHLDHEAVGTEVHFQGGVIEVARLATFVSRHECLEDAPAPADATRRVAGT